MLRMHYCMHAAQLLCFDSEDFVLIVDGVAILMRLLREQICFGGWLIVSLAASILPAAYLYLLLRCVNVAS